MLMESLHHVQNLLRSLNLANTGHENLLLVQYLLLSSQEESKRFKINNIANGLNRICTMI